MYFNLYYTQHIKGHVGPMRSGRNLILQLCPRTVEIGFGANLNTSFAKPDMPLPF